MSARRAKSNHMVHHVIWRQSHPILLSCEKSEIDEIKWKWIHFLSITVTVIQSSKNGLIQWNCTTLSLSIKSNLKIRKKKRSASQAYAFAAEFSSKNMKFSFYMHCWIISSVVFITQLHGKICFKKLSFISKPCFQIQKILFS